MDDIFIYLLVAAVVAVFIVTLNHTRQKGRMHGGLKNAEGAAPVMLQNAVDRKLINLKTALYNETSAVGLQLQLVGFNGRSAGTYPVDKQRMVARLNELEKARAADKLSLKNYDEELRLLLMKLPQ